MTEKKLIKTEKFKTSSGIMKSYNYYEFIIDNKTIHEWRRFGILSSPNDLPALTYPHASFWYQNGRLHREHAPAMIRQDTHYEWYYDGLLHRLDGPAIYNTDNPIFEEWYYDGFCHRNNGPAKIHGNIKEYYWKGHKYDFDKYAKLATLNYEEKCEIILQYG